MEMPVQYDEKTKEIMKDLDVDRSEVVHCQVKLSMDSQEV